MATNPATLQPQDDPQAPPQPANDPNAAVYAALRKADAAGDADAVAKLAAYLKTQPAPLVSGKTQGFADEAPVEAQASQLPPEQEKALVEYARQPGSTADGLRQLGAKFGHTITNADEVFKARDLGAGVNDTISYPLPKAKDGTTVPGAIARGVGDGVTIGLLPRIGALAHATSDLAHGGDFDYTQKLDEQRGVQAADTEQHPYARIGGQLLGGLALPAGTEGVAFTAGRDALQGGASMAEARAIASAAARNRATAVSAGYGGAYGVDSSYGSPGERLASGVTGALEGGAGGLAVGSAAEALAPRAEAARVALRAQPLTDGQRYFAAAERANVTPFAADVGGPGIKRAVAGAIQTPFGAGPLTEAANATLDTAKVERDRIAGIIGTALRPEAAGEGIRSGAQSTIASTRNDARAFYGAAESQSKGATVNTPKAIAALDENIADLAQTPGGAPGLSTLQGIRDQLAKGGVSVAGLRNMRTVLRDQFLKDGLRGSDTERRVNQVVDAAAQDVSDGLSAKGMGDAAANFASGDAAWKARSNLIDTVYRPIIGTRDNPRSGEQIIKTLTADLQGNNARAAKLLNSLPDAQRNNTIASIIAGLGRVAKGQQNAEGDAFSLPTFLTNWNEIGEGAKRAYFGPEARAALNDLATVAEGAKNAQKYAGHSNTAAVHSFNATTGGLWGAISSLFSGVATGHPLLGAAGFAAGAAPAGYQFLNASLLTSPRFVRWIARAPRTSLGSAAYLDRLTRIAHAEPAIANDVLQLQQRLTEMLGSAPQQAAAGHDKRGTK